METLGFNSPSHNPENELPQWQQKIADAENNDNNQAIGPRLSAFSPSFISHICLSNCNGYFGRKAIRVPSLFITNLRIGELLLMD